MSPSAGNSGCQSASRSPASRARASAIANGRSSTRLVLTRALTSTTRPDMIGEGHRDAFARFPATPEHSGTSSVASAAPSRSLLDEVRPVLRVVGQVPRERRHRLLVLLVDEPVDLAFEVLE